MDKHKGTRTINSNTTADFHADYATLFVVLHYHIAFTFLFGLSFVKDI
jgi:hypothetical protein